MWPHHYITRMKLGFLKNIKCVNCQKIMRTMVLDNPFDYLKIYWIKVSGTYQCNNTVNSFIKTIDKICHSLITGSVYMIKINLLECRRDAGQFIANKFNCVNNIDAIVVTIGTGTNLQGPRECDYLRWTSWRAQHQVFDLRCCHISLNKARWLMVLLMFFSLRKEKAMMVEKVVRSEKVSIRFWLGGMKGRLVFSLFRCVFFCWKWSPVLPASCFTKKISFGALAVWVFLFLSLSLESADDVNC